MKTLSPEQFMQWLSEGRALQVLDVREPWEYDIVRFEPSMLVPLRTLAAKVPVLDTTKPVVVYCHHGTRSLMACTILVRQGHPEVYNLTGGIDYYARSVDPGMTRY